jgi:predicted extracellular nuclease
VAGALKVASFNLLNYFNTFGTTSCTFGVGGAAAECRGASDSGEYTRQANKTVPAIALLDADVLGVIEIENDGYGASSAIQDLVNRVNAVMGTNTYAFIDFDARLSRTNAGGTDAIKVGILYKPASVTPVAGATFGDPDPIHNRAPLAQTFQQISNGERFTLIVNHFKSKSCDSASGADIDQNDGQGCYNARRVSQAHALVSFIQQITTATGDPDVLMMGDLNSYAKEDPISVLLAGGLTNLTLQFGGPNAYSYAFDGQWGYLDHALATASATLQVKDAADFHINSDEPSVLDYLNDFKSANQQTILYAPDAYRTSDHDPAVVSLQLGKTVAAVPATHPYLVAWLALGLIAVGAGLWRRAHQH